MTTITAVHLGRNAVIAADQIRARSVVLHHARDDAEAAELLAMLGLADDQQDSATPRGRGELTSRQPGGVHALSAATEARLAANGESANNTAVPPPVVPAVAAPTTRSHAAVDRRCEGCGAPVVPQTRYKLDPDGYRERGVKLLAAKDRCHPCYNRLGRPAAADADEPKNPRRCKKCERPMVAARVFSANPDKWRRRGWMAHAAHGVCRNCRSADDSRRLRSERRAARRAPVLCDLVYQLTALRMQVRDLRISHPDDEQLACAATALGEARRHLDAASVRVATESGDAPNQGGDQ